MRAVERSSWRTRGSIVVVVVVVVAAIVLMREYDVRLYAQIALIIAAVFFLASIFLGEPDRYNVRKHAKLSMALTLVFLCTANVRSHPWFRPGGSGTVEGMMVVLLWQDDRLLGALSLTSRTPDAIPVSGSKSLELLEILNLWKRSFVVPLARLYAVRETSPT